MEFLHFLAFTRESFDDLVKILTPGIISSPIKEGHGKPSLRNLKKRLVTPRDIVAMTVKFLISTAEQKDIQIMFGVTNFSDIVRLGTSLLIKYLANHQKSRVFWDRSDNNMARVCERTKQFTGLPGVVAMIDGLKLGSLSPADYIKQNNDYNGWTCDVNRNLCLVWDPFGLVVDAVVNAPIQSIL